MRKTGTKRIETPRLILRRYTLSDVSDMYRNWASDPNVTRYLTWPPHGSEEVTKAVVADWVSRYENGDTFNWAIEWKETGAVIGNIAAVYLDEAVDGAEIGYCLGRAFWGRGVMTEALRAVIDYLFDEAGMNRIAAYHDARNPASGRVMEKAGMKTEGVLRQSRKSNAGVGDAVWHAILKSDRA